MVVKELVQQVADELPKDATLDEALDRILLLYKIEVGRDQVRTGQVVSHEEATARLSKWLR